MKVKVAITKEVENPGLFPKISIGNNSGSIKHRAMKFACITWVFGYDVVT